MSWGRFGAAVAVSFILSVVNTGTVAQAAGPLDSARSLADGGKHGAAISAYSKVLNSGSLSPGDTARGFYLRGVSYGKARKNPQAISDLTNALWLTGLSQDERANAFKMRAAAYRASGFKRKAAADLKRAGAQTGRVEPPAAVGLTTTVTAADPKLAAQAKAPTGSGWTVEANPAQSTTSAPSGGGNAVSNFFSGIFGGGGNTKPVKQAPTATKTAAVARPAAANTTAVSSWSSEVNAQRSATRPAKTIKPVKRVAARQPVPTNWDVAVAPSKILKPKPVVRKTVTAVKKPVKAPAPKAGRYNVQVATVRERADAEQILKSLPSKAPKKLAGLRTSIDQAVLGNMGTFYRVRVDGLATRQASVNLCKVLQKSGHDCFLIGR